MPRERLFRRNAVRECLRAGRRQIFRLVLASDARPDETRDILAEARRRRIPVETVAPRVIEEAARGERHQNLMLETGSYPYADLADLPAAAAARAEPALLLLLDLVQDPQNVGALLRTAEAMGVHGAILQRRRGCEITPAVVTASAGAVEHLQVAQVTNLVEAMRWLKQQGIWLIGLERGAEARPLETMDLQMPAGLVIGSEGEGLRRLVREQCDFLAQVAMYGRVESLNAAAAGSIALYAARVARKV